MKARSSDGVAYLLVGASMFALTIWLPIVATLYTSFQKSNLIRPASWVGLANYRALMADRLLPTALLNVAALILIRALVIICIWKILEFAWSKGQRISTLFVLIAVAPLPFMTVVGTSSVWRYFGQADAGVFHNLVAWTSPDRAKQSLYLVDALHTLAIASALGVVIYALAQRTGGSPIFGHPDISAFVALADRRSQIERLPSAQALSMTRNIALSIAAATALQSFDWSFTITGGGPASATMTPALLIYSFQIQRLTFGPGAALAILLILLLLIPAWYIWLAMRSFNLQLAPLRASNHQSNDAFIGANGLVLLSLVPAIIILAPLVEVFRSSEPLGRPDLLYDFPWIRLWLNSLLPSGLAIWLIQIPMALATAIGLVMVFIAHPWLGRALLLPFVAMSVIGPAVIAGALYRELYLLRALDTLWGSTVPLWSNGLTLLVFLLFLSGVRSRLERAWLSGKSISKTFLNDILPSMGPVILLVGLVNMYWASQSIFWPLILLYNEQRLTASVALLRILPMGEYRPAEALLPLLPVAAMFAVGFVLCTYLLITRIRLWSAA